MPTQEHADGQFVASVEQLGYVLVCVRDAFNLFLSSLWDEEGGDA